MHQVPQFDMTSSEFKKSPYDLLNYLREHNPVAKIELPGGRSAWLITRYEDVEAAFRDPRFITNPRHVYPPEVISMIFSKGEFSEALLTSMLFTAPPDHTRLRTLVSLSFTPRFIETWRDRVQEIIDELIDQLPEHGEIDLIEKITFPLPMIVISEILGIPVEDREKFRHWSNLYADSMGNPAASQSIREDMDNFYNYLLYLIELKRQEPTNDLLSKLIVAESEGDTLSPRELVGMMLILILAGNETTTTLIGRAMLTLFQHPEQMELLKNDPSLIKPAVEEFIRYSGPLLNANDRWAGEDFEFRGQPLKKGDAVYFSISSANRDDSRFTNAHHFDIHRKDIQQHLGFGKGIHYCLGAPLARLEAQIGINTILRRMPNIRLNVDPQELTWRSGAVAFSLTALPVVY